MLAWSEGTITDVRKPEIMVNVIVGGELFTGLLRSPSQTCHAKPKTQINRRRTLPASSRWWDAYRKKPIPGKTFRKVRTLWHWQWLRSVALSLYDWSCDIRQAIDRCSNIWASLPGAGYGQFEHKADSLIAKFKEGRNGQRDWYEQSHRDYLRSGYLHHRLPVMAVNQYYQITPLPTKPSATKMPENWSWRTRQLLTCRCVSVMLLRSMQNTHELADAKAGNDALRDDVAAGRRRLHIKAVCQSVREATRRLRRG